MGRGLMTEIGFAPRIDRAAVCRLGAGRRQADATASKNTEDDVVGGSKDGNQFNE